MKIYRLNRNDGQCFAFEVENAYIRPKTIAKLVSDIVGISKVNAHSSSKDIHLEFKYKGKDFIVWEPYGDNSHYWIGPKQEHEVVDITSLTYAFETYQLSLSSKFFGHLLTLKF